MLNYDREGRHNMMDEREQAFLKNLPDEFTVFRGHQEENQLGYSWSLSHWHAYWFSRRFAQEGDQTYVSETVCSKKDVVAVLLGRTEWEIVLDPENLDIRDVQYPDRPTWMKDVYKQAKAEGFKSARYHHGWEHWLKVERNAVALAKEEGADVEVCQLFGILHDCKRWSENEDPDHGSRAAKYAEELFREGKLNITLEQLEKLCFACIRHTDGTTSNDPTIGCCWDADRLDLVRVGITPDPRYLSTKAALKLMWKT